MPNDYPAELRRRTCERMLAGDAVKDLVVELGRAQATLYKWRRQALIDAGQRPGLKSYEVDPLLAARRRVKELEAELKAVKAGSALFEEGVADPCRAYPCSANRDHLGGGIGGVLQSVEVGDRERDGVGAGRVVGMPYEGSRT